MKSKKALFILIPSLLLIWGYIGFIIYQSFNPPKPEVSYSKTSKNQQQTEFSESKYELKLDYQDPFLKKQKSFRRRQPQLTTQSHIKTRKKTKAIEKMSWPTIKYYGYVKRGGEVKAIASVNGNHKILNQKDIIFDQIILDKIFSDSLLVVQNSEKKVILKN